MRSEFIAAIGGFAIALLALPAILLLCRKLDLYDSLGPLKIHNRRVPRLGGVAIAAGTLTAAFLSGVVSSPRSVILLSTFILVWGTGLIDDIRGLSPWIRLTVQLGAGLLLSLAGWSIRLFNMPVLDTIATCILVAAFINAFNLLDGADGVAGSVALVIVLGYALLPAGQLSLSGRAVAWALAGSCLAFMMFNFPPARIFMGDSGSTLLGLGIAFLGLDFCAANPGLDSRLGIPIVFAALPLVDLGLSILRRLRRRAPIFEGDRQHFYDLLLQHGWPAWRVALTCSLCTAFFVVLGRVTSQQPGLVFSLVFAASLLLFATIAVGLGSLRVETESAPTIN